MNQVKKAPLATAVCVLFLSCIVLTACTKLSPEEQASQAALSYYNRLLEGYPDGLLAAKVGTDTLSSDYRHRLVKAYEQYLSDVKAKHGGIRSIAVSNNVARRDSTLGITYAFLMLSFKDSTSEEIVVPMVEVGGEWKIK